MVHVALVGLTAGLASSAGAVSAVWLRSYPEVEGAFAGGECVMWVAAWSDGVFTRVPLRCPGLSFTFTDLASNVASNLSVVATTTERGPEGCAWYVTQWSNGLVMKAPADCPPGVQPVREGAADVRTTMPTAVPTETDVAAPAPSWLRSYPEQGTRPGVACDRWVAAWSDGSFTSVPLVCPGAQLTPAGLPWATTYPEVGAEGCTWYVARWGEATFTKAPVACPPGRQAAREGLAAAGPAPAAGGMS